jgi:hypothetical protein
MTLFEQLELQSPVVKRPKPEGRRYSSNPPVSLDSQCFDVSAAWHIHPEPFSGQPSRPITPPSVLLPHEVRDLSHHSSTDSSSSTLGNDRVRPPYSCCCPVPEQSGSNTETNECCICTDIAFERGRPDTQSLNSAEILKAGTHKFPTRHHRRCSLFYEPTSLSADKGMEPLGQLSKPLGEKWALNSCSDPYFPGAEERLSGHKVSLDEWERFCRVQKDRSKLRIKKERLSSRSISQDQDNEVGRGDSERYLAVTMGGSLTRAPKHTMVTADIG